MRKTILFLSISIFTCFIIAGCGKQEEILATPAEPVVTEAPTEEIVESQETETAEDADSKADEVSGVTVGEKAGNGETETSSNGLTKAEEDDYIARIKAAKTTGEMDDIITEATNNGCTDEFVFKLCNIEDDRAENDPVIIASIEKKQAELQDKPFVKDDSKPEYTHGPDHVAVYDPNINPNIDTSHMTFN